MKTTCCNADVIQAADGDGWMCKQCCMPIDKPAMPPTETKLLPCPFCGKSPTQETNYLTVKCNTVGCNAYRYMAPCPPLKWNTRTSSPETKDLPIVIAEALVDKYEVVNASRFCDEVDWDFARLEDLVLLIRTAIDNTMKS